MTSTLARVAYTVLATAAVLTVVACSSPAPVETPHESAPRSAEPTPTPTETTSQLNPDGSAEDNLEYFNAVNQGTIDSHDDPISRDFINGLVNAGFDKDAMEVTEDYSTVGNRAESIQFSVRWNDECLMGQYGSAVDGYHSAILPVLDTGTCLVGNTQPIDW